MLRRVDLLKWLWIDTLCFGTLFFILLLIFATTFGVDAAFAQFGAGLVFVLLLPKGLLLWTGNNSSVLRERTWWRLSACVMLAVDLVFALVLIGILILMLINN